MAIVPNRNGFGGVDLRYSSPNRFLLSTAIAGTTPLYAGEVVVATDTGMRYLGLATKLGAWGDSNKAPPKSTGSMWPDATNTGPAAGTVFTPFSGTFNTTGNGQVVEKLNITGTNAKINIRHSNVIIRDCIIASDEIVAIGCIPSDGSLGAPLIERVRITGIGGSNCVLIESGTGAEIRFCDISGFENGIAIGGNAQNIHDNYIHGLMSLAGTPHIDGIQGAGGFTSLTIRHNTIVSWDTSCIIMQTEGASYSNLVIDNNRLLMDPAHVGAELAYGVLAQRKDTDVGTVTNVTVTNNRIQKAQPAQSYIFLHNVLGTITVSGNVDDTTGNPVTADIS